MGEVTVSESWEWAGSPGGGILRLPPEPAWCGVVALSGARPSAPDQPLFEHLAAVLVPLGVAVLTYQRRAVRSGSDTPLRTQARDAISAVRALRARLDAPVGVFGFSQGAWAATVAAADRTVDHLVVLGHCGVTPAEQMRYSADQRLLAAGVAADDRGRARALRQAYEAAMRGTADRGQVNDLLAEASSHSWFGLSYLPDRIRPDQTWDDIDFDPVPAIRGVRCPTMAMWGEQDEVVPVAASRDAWQSAPTPLAEVVLPHCGHWPIPADGPSGRPDWHAGDVPSPDYGRALSGWYGSRSPAAN